MSLDDLLRERRVAADLACAHRVALYDRADPAQAEALERLLREQSELRVRDTLPAQVAELLSSRRPHELQAGDDEQAAAFLAQQGGARYGRWAHYPWRAELVRLLPREAFRELRANRNQLTITAEEQRHLRGKRIAIVGLSVGHCMAVTLALEGVGGHFLLADPDSLALSNTNRVPAGVSAIGANKASLAAQRMAEIDPYLDLEVWVGGVDRNDPGRLFREFLPDLLVEECDDLVLKLALREHARRHRVPVVTETSQRGLIDVERFDLEPERPLLHGLLGGVDARSLADLSTREKAPFGLRFMQGVEQLDCRLAASLVEIEQSLEGWPQIGSAVTLGGAMVTDVARRLLLGERLQSGRFRVDLGRLVADDSPLRELGEGFEPGPPAKPRADAPAVVRPDSFLGRGVRGWLEAALLAPSGGNSQPWRFAVEDEGQLTCRLERSRAFSALDPRGRAAYLACGAAAEHLRLAAAADGHRARLRFFDGDDGRVFEAHFEPVPELEVDPLWQWVGLRCTNRRLGARRSLPQAVARELAAQASRAGGRLQWIDGPEELEEVASVLGELERIRVLSPALHAAMVAELNVGPGSESAPVGIAEASLELGEMGQAALAVLRRPDVVSVLSREQAGGGVRNLVRDAVAGASAFARLSVAGGRPDDFARGGVALARLWLAATALGVSLQPMGAGAYMLAQLDFGTDEGALEPLDRQRLAAVRPAYHAVFPPHAGFADALLFRLHVAAEPSVRSARLPLEAVLEG